MLMCLDNRRGQWADIDTPAGAGGQALSAFRELDTEDSGFVHTATAAAYLERMGYSEEEVAEFTYATDANGDGVIDADEWAAAFGQHSRTPFRRGASHSAPTAGVAVAVARAAPPARSLRTARHGSMARLSGPVDRALQVTEADLVAAGPGGSSIRGRVVFPTPMGIQLQRKDDLLRLVEAEKEALRLRIRELEAEVADGGALAATAEVAARALADAAERRRSMEAQAAAVAAATVSVGPLTPPPRALAEMFGTSVADGLRSRPLRPVQWLHRTLCSVLQDKAAADAADAARGAPAQPLASFLLAWMRTRFGVEGLARQNAWDFHAAIRRYRRVGGERQDVAPVPGSSESIMWELVAGFCDGSAGVAEQTAFVCAWTLIRAGEPRETAMDQPIRLSATRAAECALLVLPCRPGPLREAIIRIVEKECQNRDNAGAAEINDADVSAVSSENSAGSDSELGTVKECELLACLVRLRRELQDEFRNAVQDTFQAAHSTAARIPGSGNNPPVSAGLEYPAVERLFVDFVTGGSNNSPAEIGGVALPQASPVTPVFAVTAATPALVSAVLRGAVEALAPGLLVPGARIDVENLLLLDSASDLLGRVSIRVCNSAATAISTAASGGTAVQRQAGRNLGERVRRR
jgi:hypothetical protein